MVRATTGVSAEGTDVVVVGAGVVGLASAWRCAQRGLSVTVVDPRPGRGASWMAAGMLAPVSEVHTREEPLLHLALAAAAQWPSFAAALEESAGSGVGYRPGGTLIVAADEGDRAWARDLLDVQLGLGLEARWLTGRQARALEPALAPSVRGAIDVAGDHQVDNRLLVGTLLAAVDRAGVTLCRDEAAALVTTGGAVTGVRLRHGAPLGAGTVVVAAGCWSGGIGGLPPGAVPPVRPVKGEILRLRPAPGAPVLARTVRAVVGGSSVYLVPRGDGTVVVGATVEERGFDTGVRAGGVYALLRDAHRVVPAVTEMVLDEAGAGLRPGSPDNAPMVGRCPAPDTGGTVAGLVLATGHYRHGILLTPPTSDAVAALAAGEEAPAVMAPFSPARFAAGAAPARP
ncbi:MAG TPA: glycine oxidase ThiO [Acidimicrobiales bacterium]|nr:glycine oxidase ThiO [Acidimicrobiales bacterium]